VELWKQTMKNINKLRPKYKSNKIKSK
jgi:hypothetical protein